MMTSLKVIFKKRILRKIGRKKDKLIIYKKKNKKDQKDSNSYKQKDIVHCSDEE